MYVKRKIKTRSHTNCCRGKAICITYSECELVALGIQACMAHAYHLWALSLCHILQNLANDTIFGKKLFTTKCVLIFSTTFVSNISHSKQNYARYDHKCILVFM